MKSVLYFAFSTYSSYSSTNRKLLIGSCFKFYSNCALILKSYHCCQKNFFIVSACYPFLSSGVPFCVQQTFI